MPGFHLSHRTLWALSIVAILLLYVGAKLQNLRQSHRQGTLSYPTDGIGERADTQNQYAFQVSKIMLY
jgi:hypothetical protein